MREILVSNLIKDLLGPRNGIREEFNTNQMPLTEFTTGILSPKDTTKATVLDETPNLNGTFPTLPLPTVDGDESEEQESIALNPSLNPQKPSPSMGISFQVKAESSPEFKICLTWAKYLHSSKWLRHPKYALLSLTTNSKEVQYFDSLGKKCSEDSAEISFHFKIVPVGNSFFVSMFLVNESRIPEDSKNFSEYHIFQPQIRIVFESGTERIEMKDNSYDPEIKKTELLYSNAKRKSYARGHMTSVLWKEIDPEIIPDDLRKEFPDAANELGFCWVDREIIPDGKEIPFQTPDLRTEFIPMYSIPSPDIEWGIDEDEPVLYAKVFSQMWDSKELEKSLKPIVRQYGIWISSLEKTKDGVNDDLVDKIIVECKGALERIDSGITLLVEDPDARLAFCFANMAMNRQTQWSRNEDLKYRPFQIAFILLSIESILSKNSKFRDTCDLLWVPTGGGKTEAYLTLVAIDMAYRRLKSTKLGKSGSGVSVFTRYTLRLLTIQQFRRSLSMFSAAESLRVENLGDGKPIGWRPDQYTNTNDILWGSTPFSVGLWVGDGVTPNKLKSRNYKIRNRRVCRIGALDQLKQKHHDSGCKSSGEPAQILNCPACNGILALPSNSSSGSFHNGLDSNTPYVVTWIIKSDSDLASLQSELDGFDSDSSPIKIEDGKFSLLSRGYFALRIKFINKNQKTSSSELNKFWNLLQNHLNLDNSSLQSTSAARPGYFFKKYKPSRSANLVSYDFEIFCTNDSCPLHQDWFAGSPMGGINGSFVDPSTLTNISEGISLQDGNMLVEVQKCFMKKDFVSDRIPIPGTTVDDQVYKNLPTMVVATVDKFARLPFEPRASGLFGNVEYCHMLHGYYRVTEEDGKGDKHPDPIGTSTSRSYRLLNASEIPRPPNFIIQDELHLIDGPLGSMVGLYESCVDFLSNSKYLLKYIASTATIKRGDDQIRSLFSRKLQTFPPSGVSVDDRFFIHENKFHPLVDDKPGRLYVGVMAPGKGALTPIVRLWASLAQTAHVFRENPEIDRFWTLVGYFNAIRELGGGLSIYRQDIPSRIQELSRLEPGTTPRLLDQNTIFELSGRTSSDALPSILDDVNKEYNFKYNMTKSPDALFTTSMFGTGVDISRLGLMLVNGQPKTTSSYIQSTGRVGRSKGGLVVVFHRSTRPRDLSHYEYFMRYHTQMHRTVESPTVYPFSPGAVGRSLGPLLVGMLRNMRNPKTAWQKKNSPILMANCTAETNPEFKTIAKFLEERGQSQPLKRTPEPDTIYDETKRCIDVWTNIAKTVSSLEYSAYNDPDTAVVLGDMVSERDDAQPSAFHLAPQSLRDIEGETSFGVKR